MANNFHIFSHKTTETLHIKLTGDFDGSSASELINALSDNQNRYYQIFINTTELNDIHPFGQEVLHGRLSELNDQGSGVIFIGKNLGQSLELN
jgi:hypothetical protein